MSTTYYLAHGDMSEAYLAHHGVRGQKWGLRRFQNRDGSYTAAGQGRYASLSRHGQRKYNKIERRMDRNLARSQQDNEQIRRNREATRARLISKRERLESKRNSHNSDKIDAKIKKVNARIKDHQAGDKYINAGLKRHEQTINKYKDMQLNALSDKSVKKSDAYKDAKRNYKKQVGSDLMYGRQYTKLNYALEAGGSSKAARKAETDKIEKKASRKGGKISKKGGEYKYTASNGVTVAAARDPLTSGARKFSKSAIGSAAGTMGAGLASAAAGTSFKATQNAAKEERKALREYYSVGGDKMLRKYNKAKSK